MKNACTFWIALACKNRMIQKPVHLTRTVISDPINLRIVFMWKI